MTASIAELDRGAFLDAIEQLSPPDAAIAMDERCRSDVYLFCAAYLYERFPSPFNRMHLDFLSRPKESWRDRREVTRIADAAPRGGAKSTLESWATVIHDVCYGLERFVCIISTTFKLSEDLVRDLHEVFTDADVYADLHEAYGPFKVKGGATDFTVSRGGNPTCRIAAFSFGGSIRGSKHQGVRPTKVIIDDGEHPERVRSPTGRQKTWEFLTKDILKCGSRYSVYRIVGTVLHPESMLETILTKSPGWKTTRWRSVIEWPERMDMWDRCERLWADLDDPDREASARRYYERNREEMDRGAVVLWPDHEPLWDLMVMRWTEGEAAFLSEKQNEPTDPTRQKFHPKRWPRCKVVDHHIITSGGRRIPLSGCDVAVWLDPRASEEIKRNDYAACAIVARERGAPGDVSAIYVLDVLMGRVDTEEQVAWLWTIFDRFNKRADYGYENNGFARFLDKVLDATRRERRQKGLSDQLPLIGYNSSENKLARIMSLAPSCRLGWIEFAERVGGLVFSQFRALPTATHDDGPDAVERAIWLLTGGGKVTADMDAEW